MDEVNDYLVKYRDIFKTKSTEDVPEDFIKDTIDIVLSSISDCRKELVFMLDQIYFQIFLIQVNIEDKNYDELYICTNKWLEYYSDLCDKLNNYNIESPEIFSYINLYDIAIEAFDQCYNRNPDEYFDRSLASLKIYNKSSMIYYIKEKLSKNEDLIKVLNRLEENEYGYLFRL